MFLGNKAQHYLESTQSAFGGRCGGTGGNGSGGVAGMNKSFQASHLI